jgi:hypothetical protein
MNRRTVGTVLLASFFFILCLSMAWTSTAQTGASQIPIGVKVGDSFTYSSQLSIVPGGSVSGQASDFYSLYSNLEWFKLTITNIENDRLVDYSMVYHYSDGTESTSGYFSGGTYLDGSGNDFFVFPSGLAEGGALYPFPADQDAQSYTISETTPVIYHDSNRMTNHVHIADFGHHLPKGDLYFDQDTGALAQYIFLIPESIGSTVAALSWNMKLIGSNVWSVASTPSTTPSNTPAPATTQPTLTPTPTPSRSPTIIVPTPIAPSPSATANQSTADSWLNPTALATIAIVVVIVAVVSILFVYLKRHIRIVRV